MRQKRRGLFGEIMKAFEAALIKPAIAFDVLEKIDIRVGTIEGVEDVPKSDRLVRLTVDLGDHTRTILVGMKQERHKTRRRSRGSRRCSW